MEKSEIRFNTAIYSLDYLLGVHYLLIPKKIIDLIGTLKKRLLCTVNDALTFQCGMVALGDGKAYISLNGKRMKQLGVKKGDRVSVVLKEDPSKYGMEVPKELAELFRQDPEGKLRFNKLTPAMQRYILFYINGVKSSHLRVDRAVLLISNLKKLPKGKETFRGMLGKE